jgi:hypothetical protein
MKLLTECESVTQKVLLLVESILRNAKQLQQAYSNFYASRQHMKRQKILNCMTASIDRSECAFFLHELKSDLLPSFQNI